ncbi:hypothetical protein [Lysobacter gummosus]|uniref:hypothetical protein n=1 Tax=Lysobacter gummosus TaxID=262324 RepID=UPI00362B0210
MAGRALPRSGGSCDWGTGAQARGVSRQGPFAERTMPYGVARIGRVRLGRSGRLFVGVSA